MRRSSENASRIASLALAPLIVAYVGLGSLGIAQARPPGNCYCNFWQPPFLSQWASIHKNPVHYSGAGGNYYPTNPFDVPSSGEVGVDQYSEAAGPYGNYELITTLGWSFGSFETDFQNYPSYTSPITFVAWWNIDWAYVPSVIVDPGKCGGSASWNGQLVLTLNYYDITAGKYIFNPAPSYSIFSGNYQDGSYGTLTYEQTDSVALSTVQQLFHPGDLYSVDGYVVVETQSLVNTCGDVQSDLNIGDNGGGAWMTEIGWSSA